MKTWGLLIGLLFPIVLYPQNPFADGIHASDEVEYRDGNLRFSASAFKVSFPDNCKVVYTATEMRSGQFKATTTMVETSWNWKDVYSMELDTVKNILRLNAKAPMPCKRKDLDTEEITEDPGNNVAEVYFKTKVLAKNAGKWVISQVKKCGGSVKLLN